VRLLKVFAIVGPEDHPIRLHGFEEQEAVAECLGLVRTACAEMSQDLGKAGEISGPSIDKWIYADSELRLALESFIPLLRERASDEVKDAHAWKQSRATAADAQVTIDAAPDRLLEGDLRGILTRIVAGQDPTPLAETNRWIKITEAERVSAINKGVISRAADRGDIKSNDKKGPERRIDGISFLQWVLQRAEEPSQPNANHEELSTKVQESRLHRGVYGDD